MKGARMTPLKAAASHSRACQGPGAGSIACVPPVRHLQRQRAGVHLRVDPAQHLDAACTQRRAHVQPLGVGPDPHRYTATPATRRPGTPPNLDASAA